MMTSLVSQMTSGKHVHAVWQSKSPLLNILKVTLVHLKEVLMANMFYVLEELREILLKSKAQRWCGIVKQYNQQADYFIVMLVTKFNQYDILLCHTTTLLIWPTRLCDYIIFYIIFVWWMNQTCYWCLISLCCHWCLLYELEKCSIQLVLLLVPRWCKAHATPCFSPISTDLDCVWG